MFSLSPSRNKRRSDYRRIGRQLRGRADGGRGLLYNTAAVGQRPAHVRPSVADHPVRRRGRPGGVDAGLVPRSPHAVFR